MGADGPDVRFQAVPSVAKRTLGPWRRSSVARSSVPTVALILAFDRPADFTTDRGRGWQVVV
jgi:hypothetical protein